jgi:hypothetical protein
MLNSKVNKILDKKTDLSKYFQYLKQQKKSYVVKANKGVDTSMEPYF